MNLQAFFCILMMKIMMSIAVQLNFQLIHVHDIGRHVARPELSVSWILVFSIFVESPSLIALRFDGAKFFKFSLKAEIMSKNELFVVK